MLRFAFWSATALAFVMATLPHPPALDVSDKLQHMLAFLVITLLGCAAYPNLSRLRLAVALVAFGGLIEIVQMLPMLGRDSELGDWAADVLAVLIALGGFSLGQRFGTERPD